MGNHNQQDLINTIITAVYVGNGKEAAQKINEEFILIRKSDLPAIENQPHHFRDLQVPTARTAGYRLGGNPQTYWNRALDFISVAIYAEQEEAKQAEQKLDATRKDAYIKLFPFASIEWNYSTLEPHIRRKVDVVVNLMNQIDELKDSK